MQNFQGGSWETRISALLLAPHVKSDSLTLLCAFVFSFIKLSRVKLDNS